MKQFKLFLTVLKKFEIIVSEFVHRTRKTSPHYLMNCRMAISRRENLLSCSCELMLKLTYCWKTVLSFSSYSGCILHVRWTSL